MITGTHFKLNRTTAAMLAFALTGASLTTAHGEDGKPGFFKKIFGVLAAEARRKPSLRPPRRSNQRPKPRKKQQRRKPAGRHVSSSPRPGADRREPSN